MKIEDKDIWLSALEIADLELENLPHSKTAVIRWANEGEWEKRRRKGKGGGFVYSFISLPEEARQEIKAHPLKWQLVCEISEERSLNGQKKQFKKILENKKIPLSAEMREFITASAHRLIVEEYKSNLNRADIAKELDISLAELEEYEHGEKSLNAFHFKKLRELNFDVWFILFGEESSNEKKIHNEVKNTIGTVNIKN